MKIKPNIMDIYIQENRKLCKLEEEYNLWKERHIQIGQQFPGLRFAEEDTETAQQAYAERHIYHIKGYAAAKCYYDNARVIGKHLEEISEKIVTGSDNSSIETMILLNTTRHSSSLCDMFSYYQVSMAYALTELVKLQQSFLPDL